MAEFIYLLSNPSMPGLIKIGKTTKPPLQRMAELNTTGVPTPFELECAFQVDDCTARESSVHKVLAKSRLEKREFFRTDMNSALKKILPVLGDYSVYHAKSEYGVESLAAKLREKQEARVRREESLKEERKQRAIAQHERSQRRLDVQESLLVQQREAQEWYRQELARRFPHRPNWHYGVFVGLLTALVLRAVDPGLSFGKMFVYVVIVGWVGGGFLRSRVDGWRANSSDRAALENELDSRLKIIREIVCPCPNCGQSLRFDRVDVLSDDGQLDWNCPNCKAEVSPFP